MTTFYQGTYEKSVSLERGEYEDCTFKNCNFANQFLNGYTFENCSFTDCNLSNANIQNSSFRQVHFERCKLLGIHFNTANPFLFEVYFTESQADFSSFYQCNLKSSKFNKSQFVSVDFSDSNLSGVSLNSCDFKNAIFNNTNLEKADFSTANNFEINPERNKIKHAKFSLQGLQGLLQHHKIIIK